MRLRIADRILVAIAGLLLLALCAGIVAQMFFNVDLVSLAVRVFSSDAPQVRWGLIGLAAVLLLLGIYCVMVLFRHRRRKDKFILQKNDSGELAISIKALENMVRKCIDQHQEIDIQHLYLENRKDGLLIRLRGSVAGGISIPLTVEALQKQIRQYVTACSGVEIKGVRVQIESSGEDAADAPFAIAAPAAKPLLKEPAPEQTPVQNAEQPAAVSAPEPESMAAPVPAEPEQEIRPVSPEPVIPVPDDDDDRPLHQRLFSAEPEACIIPEPPAEPEAPVEPETCIVPEVPVKAEEALSDMAAAESTAAWDKAATETEIPEPEEAETVPEEDCGADKTAEPGDAETVPEEECDAEKTAEPENAEIKIIPEEETGEEKTDDTAEPQEPEMPSDADQPKADPDFLASLSAFDQIVTGKKDGAE